MEGFKVKKLAQRFWGRSFDQKLCRQSFIEGAWQSKPQVLYRESGRRAIGPL